MGESEFIEEYLIEHGVIQKALPEAEESRVEEPSKHSFMDKYPTQKSKEEVDFEKIIKETKIFYVINGVKYKLPYIVYQYSLRMEKSGKPLSLEKQNNGDYILSVDDKNPHDKYEMLSGLLNIIGLNVMGCINGYLEDIENEQLQDRKNGICEKIYYREYYAKKLVTENNIDKANTLLIQSIEDILKFEQEIIRMEQQEER